jgi:TonB family protein
MIRLEQKCLLVSTGMHGLLILLLVVGSAFIAPTPVNQKPLPRLNVVPSRLIDEALAGGGGNPHVTPSDAQQKGQTLQKQPEQAPPRDTRPPQPEPPKRADPVKPPEREPTRKPPEKQSDKLQFQEVTRPAPTKPNKTGLPDWLQPVTVSEADRKKAAAEAAARERATAVASGLRAIGRAKESLRGVAEGFQSGTVVQAWGPGGEAYASYDAMVEAIYGEEWRRRVPDELTDDEATCRVRVTIARNGDVLSGTIVDYSRNSALDNSVRRTLGAVKFVAPFPQGAKENQRTYTINFNLRLKRGLG